MSTELVWFYCCMGCGNKTWTQTKARHVSCMRCKTHMTVEQMPIDQARALMVATSGNKPPVRQAAPGGTSKTRTPRAAKTVPDPVPRVPAERAKAEAASSPKVKVEPTPAKVVSPCTPLTRNTRSKRGAPEAATPTAPPAPAKAEGSTVKAKPKVVQATLFDEPGHDLVAQEPVRSQRAG